MKDGKWTDWTEPLEILRDKANGFIATIKAIGSLQDMPVGGKLIEAPEIYTRKEALGKALATYIMALEGAGGDDVWTTYFLCNYIYATGVYEDVYSFVFEYIGESEHQMDLHGDEFAQTKEDLLDDFALYIENWQSPYTRQRAQMFVVSFVETDGNSFDGVSSQVMEGTDPEDVARKRVAEACQYYKEEYEKGGDAWEESLACALEDEKQIKSIVSGWHGYYRVFVFTLEGAHLEIDLIDHS